MEGPDDVDIAGAVSAASGAAVLVGPIHDAVGVLVVHRNWLLTVM